MIDIQLIVFLIFLIIALYFLYRFLKCITACGYDTFLSYYLMSLIIPSTYSIFIICFPWLQNNTMYYIIMFLTMGPIVIIFFIWLIVGIYMDYYKNIDEVEE